MSRFEGAHIGFRTWGLDGGRLHSAGGDWAWAVGDEPTEAEVCEKHPKLPPARALCTCGLHFFYEPPENLYTHRVEGVLGAAVCWGKVARQSNGFRIRWALPVAFVRHPAMTISADEALRAYASEWNLVVVDSIDELEDEALRYATKVPEELRTKDPRQSRTRTSSTGGTWSVLPPAPIRGVPRGTLGREVRAQRKADLERKGQIRATRPRTHPGLRQRRGQDGLFRGRQ